MELNKLLIFLCMLVPVLSNLWQPKPDQKYTVCNTKECVERGELYYGNSKRSVHPCTDFYEFACGNWEVHHPKPKHETQWSVYETMHRNTLEIVKEILNRSDDQPEDKDVAALKLLYDTCFNTPYFENQNPKAVGQLLSKVGVFSRWPLWEVHNGLLAASGRSAFFDINVIPNLSNKNNPVLLLSELASGYGSIRHGEAWTPEERSAYSSFVNALNKKLSLFQTEQINGLLDFREELQRITVRNKKEKADVLEPKSITYFPIWMKNEICGHEKTKLAQAPWDGMLKILLPQLPKSLRDKGPIFVVRRNQYFIDLNELLSRTPDETLINHMALFFVEEHITFEKELNDLLVKTTTEPHQFDSVIRARKEKWLKCLDNSKLYDFIVKIVLKQSFRHDYIEPVFAIVNGIRAQMLNQIWESTWLNKATKHKIRSRIEELDTWVGYPPWFTDETVRPGSPIGSHLLPNALFSEEKNVIAVRGALLKSPVFEKEIPALYNYGAIGYVIGHEFYHTIHDCGGYSKQKVAQAFWPSDMRDECKRRRECFVTEYDRFTLAIFRKKYNTQPPVNTRRSLKENFPDVMGLDAAYLLYRAALEKDRKTCQLLPHFTNYSCDQMFFLAFANTMCGSINPKAAHKRLEKDVHSLDHIRVNAALAMNGDFVRAFKCPKDSPMNSHVKCNIWK